MSDRLREAVNRAKDDPGWKFEVNHKGVRLTYTFVAGVSMYTHENFTPWRAVDHVFHNPLFAAISSSFP